MYGADSWPLCADFAARRLQMCPAVPSDPHRRPVRISVWCAAHSSRAGEKTGGKTAVRFFAPESEAMLNLWRDFRKVVKFIDINRGWLEPLLEQAKSLQ
jgi:hypothetical protein